LAAVLLFIGGKMVVEPWWKMSVAGSLGVVAGLLVVTVAASVLAGRKLQGEEK
jgi:predicted tellurium resistance membrane protein TerC